MLTDTRIRNTKPGTKAKKLSDSHGLYLEVTPAGGRLWRYRFRLDGSEKAFVIGKYPDIGLAEAREHRNAARKLVSQGLNPTHSRKLDQIKRQNENANTFEAVGSEWFETTRKKWTSEYSGKVDSLLRKDLYSKLGPFPIRSITAPAIMDVLRRIEARGAPTQALLARQLISSVFRHAIITYRADNDPAAPLKGIIARRQVEHRRHLDKRDIPGFLLALEDYTGQRQTVIAAKLLMLTAVRPRELCEALWSEFDVEEREWRIPAARMKMRVQHIVPLSRQVLALLEELRQITGDGKFLFPSQSTRAGAIPTATLRNVIRRMGWSDKVSPHGFRGTFSTFMNELGYRPDVIERQLAHSERNKVRAAYHHAEYLPERRRMLQDWADRLEAMKAGAKVIPLHGKAA